MLPERLPPRQGARLRLLVSAAVVLGVGLAAFAVVDGVTHVDVTSIRPLSLPHAAPTTPAPRPLADVGRAALPSVVTVEAERSSDEALGTGWLFDDRGDFVTNAHVVAGELAVRLTDRHDHVHVGVVVGIDQNADIAIVRSRDGFQGTPLPVDSLPISTIPLDVVALASSRATGQSDITTDRVVQLHQDVPLQNGEVQPGSTSPSVYHDMLDMQGARVYQGNSGGPVLEENGEVVGIVTLASPNGPEAFAIPVARVLAELSQLAARTG